MDQFLDLGRCQFQRRLWGQGWIFQKQDLPCPVPGYGQPGIPDIFVAMIPVFLVIGFALVARILLSLIVDTLPGEDEEYEEVEES